ncbi:MAG: MFS transporter [Rhizobiales bacterium]|nr:MFS transporter [Hyphomicrobiales bacterium]
MKAARHWAVGLTGFCSFLNLYSPQAILPLLGQEFRAGAAEISAIMTAGTLSVALIAPFTGTVADVLGRKRVIVIAMAIAVLPTIMQALAPSLEALIFWKFVQGLALPPIFAVTIAYVGEEWPRREAAAAAGIYTAGASLGGLSARFVTGVLADLVGWRSAFLVLAAVTLVSAVAVALMLPREQKFVRSDGFLASARQMLRHFRNPQLVATYAVGFGTLFNFILTFTYVSFHLAAPPYGLSASALGAIFLVYLVGTVLSPAVGRAIWRFGRRACMIGIIVSWMGGILLTLAAPLTAVVVGLAICAGAGLPTQAISTGYVAISAERGASSAVGLYVSAFYVGGSVGAALGGVAWIAGSWPACVALVLTMLVVMATVVWTVWTPGTPVAPQRSIS